MSASIELPKYKCHKDVWAFRIKAFASVSHGTKVLQQFIIPENERYGRVEVTQEWIVKNKPVAGGYYVQYADGFTSFSPAKAFEEGYSLI